MAQAPTADDVVTKMGQLDHVARSTALNRCTFGHLAFNEHGELVSAVHIPKHTNVAYCIGACVTQDDYDKACPPRSKNRSLFWPLPQEMANNADPTKPFRFVDSQVVGLQLFHFIKRRDCSAEAEQQREPNVEITLHETPNYASDPVLGQMLIAMSTRPILPDKCIVAFNCGKNSSSEPMKKKLIQSLPK